MSIQVDDVVSCVLNFSSSSMSWHVLYCAQSDRLCKYPYRG